MDNRFLSVAKIVFVFIFLVIIAGGVVRMTQSGMGCPDWPKCFGRWIPPTDESQLPANYKEIYSFKYVDTSFNPYHTWTEYTNRLIGALLGLWMIVQLIMSLKYYRTDKPIFIMALIQLLLTGFQGWLGAKVVEANLLPVKVTLHMIFAFVTLAFSILIIKRARGISWDEIKVQKVKGLMLLSVVLTLIQVILGTQVREQIDHISFSLNFLHRELWIEKLDYMFFIHRSFSIIIVAISIYIFWKIRQQSPGKIKLAALVIGLIILEVIAGMVLSYAGMPAIAQPLHLLLSTALFSAQFALWARLK